MKATANAYAGPENYANQANFMAGEGYRAKHGLGGGAEVTVSLPDDGRVSSKMMRFLDKPVNLAIPALVGCTTIVVVSKKGAWANHIWEQPIFRPEEDEGDDGSLMYMRPGLGTSERSLLEKDFPREAQLRLFQENAIDRLHTRYDPVTAEHESGLDALRANGEIFDSSSDFKIYMFLPYQPIFDEADPNYGKQNPTGLKPAWDANGGMPAPRGDEGTTAYNDQLRAELKKIFGQNAPISEVIYAPDLANEDFMDSQFNSHRGRALVQYQPASAKDCNAKAQWRIFFEGDQTPRHREEWTALDAQGSGKPAQRCGPAAKMKREECERPSSTTSSPAPTFSPVYRDNCNAALLYHLFGSGELDKAVQDFCFNVMQVDKLKTFCSG
jgi:hypothetical protein